MKFFPFPLHPSDKSLLAFHAGALDRKRHERILSHLQHCARCGADLAEFDQILRTSQASLPDAPPGLLAGTRLEIAAAAAPAHSAWCAAARDEVAVLVGARQAASWASLAALQDPSSALASVSPILASFLGRRTVSSLLPVPNPGNTP